MTELHRIERRLDHTIETLGFIVSTLQDIIATESAIKDDIARVAGIVSDLEKQITDLKAQLAAGTTDQAAIDQAAQAASANKQALDAIQPPAT